MKLDLILEPKDAEDTNVRSILRYLPSNGSL